MKKLFVLACALLCSALNAMDLEMGQLNGKQKRQKVTLSELKSSVQKNNLDETLSLLKKIKVTTKAEPFVRNFEEWFNHKVNIYMLKQSQCTNFIKLPTLFFTATVSILLGGLIISIDPKALSYIAPGIFLFLYAAGATAGAIASIVDCYKKNKNIIRYTPNKEKIDIIIMQLKQIHLGIKEKQLQQEQEANKHDLKKLTNKATV